MEDWLFPTLITAVFLTFVVGLIGAVVLDTSRTHELRVECVKSGRTYVGGICVKIAE